MRIEAMSSEVLEIVDGQGYCVRLSVEALREQIATIDEKAIGVMVSEDPEFLAQFFAYGHLLPHLQVISRRYALLAVETLKLPRNPERTVALRKLLESKDCAIRCAIARTTGATR